MFVFGLGNPGSEYEYTRHNVGFMTVEKIAALKGVKFHKRCFRPVRTAVINSGRDCLAEPLTYMNSSGLALKGLVKETDSLIVICDQMDLPPGKVRIKTKGGSAGHNGLKSIISVYDKPFIHVYIGIGHPEDGDVINHVLSPFSDDEMEIVQDAVERAVEAVVEILDGRDINEVMQRVNSFHS